MEIVWIGGKIFVMKTILESTSLLFCSLGLLYLFYLLYIELKSIKEKKNKDRFFLVLILILIMLGLVIDKIEYLLNI